MQDPDSSAPDLASPTADDPLDARLERPGKILLVDDNQTNVKILTRQLSKQGYVISTASDGVEAMDAVQRDPPDLILLDLMMPRMDGFQVCESIKSNADTRDIMVIIVSAKSDLRDKVRGLDLGADDYLPKPFQMEEIEARVRAFMRIKRLQDALKLANRRIREAQAQLIQSGKLAAIGELSAGLAHEINNPVAIVYGHAQLMRRRFKDESDLPAEFRDRYKAFLETVENESKRCKSIIENLLRFARQKREAFQPIDLGEVVDASLAFFRLRFKVQNIEVTTDFAPNLPKVLGNFSPLQQVFVNIVMNAMQILPDGGKLSVKTFPIDDGVACSISDSGKGIPPENIPKLFDPFFTTKEYWEGTGLGLSVSYRIVQEHQGAIHVESQVGRGSTFTVRLPAHREAKHPASAARGRPREV